MLSKKTLWLCFRRTWSLGAAMSTRGMHRVGLLHALDPALKEIHDTPQALNAARCRYLGHVRTHPLMASTLVGLFIALEKDVAAKKLPTGGFEKMLFTTATTLSAIGDSFFSGSLLVFWGLFCALAIVWGHFELVLFCTLFISLLAFLFRICLFFAGVQRGLLVLQTLRKINLINWADGLKNVNAILVVFFLGKLFIESQILTWYGEFFALLCLLGTAFLIHKTRISRLIFLMAGFIAFMFYEGMFFVPFAL